MGVRGTIFRTPLLCLYMVVLARCACTHLRLHICAYTEGFGMSIRRGIRAIGGGTMVRPGAALLLTLLLTSP